MAPAGPPAIEMLGIVKRFPGVVANDGITFVVDPGEIHALLGENGAGKSTLMNVLFGLYHPDEGEIRVAGRPVRFHGPRDAVDAGLGMVHQHFMLIPRFTVAENVVLGSEGTGVRLDRAAAARRVGELAERYGLRVDPTGDGRRPAGRRPAAGRDPAGALPGRPDADSGRTDRPPDAPGG
jgi:simple sugar transport system ATP-binding protein